MVLNYSIRQKEYVMDPIYVGLTSSADNQRPVYKFPPESLPTDLIDATWVEISAEQGRLCATHGTLLVILHESTGKVLVASAKRVFSSGMGAEAIFRLFDEVVFEQGAGRFFAQYYNLVLAADRVPVAV